MLPTIFFLGGILEDWQNIISFESLYKAHRRARLCKRHKKEVVLYEANLSENLWALHYDLKYFRYKPGDYHCFYIYDPKKRLIQATSYRDRIVQHSLCDNFLNPLLERHLIYDNCACRKNKGTGFALKRFRKFMADYYKRYGNKGYFVKIDVRKYFENIDHSILKEKLKVLIHDENIFKTLEKIIDSHNLESNKGLPMGNQTSQSFSLFYLDSFDRYFKENVQIKFYLRYMDDIIMIIREKWLAQKCLDDAEIKLKDLKLLINPKSQIFPIKNGVEFLGWRFRLKENGKIIQKLRKNTKVRILQKIKELKYLRKIKRIPLERILNSLVSYRGFLANGNAHSFYLKVKRCCYIKN